MARIVAGIAASVAVMALLYEPADPSRAYYGTDARAHGFEDAARHNNGALPGVRREEPQL